ncbi:MAG TPA: hypothetical protein VKT22_10210 [Steroidobacteraceae bacterium]|nr:hypothetical protein [Steroidobacteraceae bacterium]
MGAFKCVVRSVCAGLVVAWVAGCATPYGSEGFTGGYKEKKLSDSAYVVSFSGNGFASQERVHYFWLYRCAELTLQNGYDLFTMRPTGAASSALEPASRLRPAVYRPTDQPVMEAAHGGGGGVVVTTVPGGGGPPKWSNSATILMYHKPLPQELLWAADAGEVIAALKAYVTSNGAQPAPNNAEIFRRSLRAHAEIQVGRNADVVATRAAGDAASDKPPRAASDVTERLEQSHLIAFHAAYREYVMRSGDHATAGDLIVDLEISPNGQVTQCRVVSPVFKDQQFLNAVQTLIRQSEFAPRDVALTDVSNLHISLAPLA